jgi:hypothetical protein
VRTQRTVDDKIGGNEDPGCLSSSSGFMNTELLTSVLRKNGHLGDATVVDVELTRLATNGTGSEFYTANCDAVGWGS